MVSALIVWLMMPLLLGGLLYLSGVRSRMRLIIAPLVLFLLPFLAAALFYLFRTPVQQGKVLSGMGPFLNIVFPAEDLYDPLAGVDLEPGINDYILTFSHKYVGRHAVELSSPRGSGFEDDQQKFHVTFEVFHDGRIVYYAEQLKGSMFWGKNDHGLHFNTYRVPEHLPVGEELTARVTIRGDVDSYLEKHGAVRLSIAKMSDE